MRRARQSASALYLPFYHYTSDGKAPRLNLVILRILLKLKDAKRGRPRKKYMRHDSELVNGLALRRIYALPFLPNVFCVLSDKEDAEKDDALPSPRYGR